MKPKFYVDGDSFVVENYNQADPFSDFFPALAGVKGKPMWVFYTNRGQAVASFGINGKDGSMLEFLPANKAYQATPILGFRTFLKLPSHSSTVYEPFRVSEENHHQKLIIRPYEIELRENNTELGIETKVVSFGVPNESHPLLARALHLKNTSSKSQTIELVDGLPRIVPWGMNDYLVKNMSRTIEAFAEVLNLKSLVPFFKLQVEPHDRPEIKWLHAGFFSFGLSAGKFMPVVVEPNLVFGSDTGFISPLAFKEKQAIPFNKQMGGNIMPSSFFYDKVVLKPHETKVFYSYYGYADNVNETTQYSLMVKDTESYFNQKREEMKTVYRDLVDRFGLRTSNDMFNLYSQATFMDNVLRGGFPMSIGSGSQVLHVFSRKHGDMERDYNAFQISATYYSQGNGNYRDVNQNRRNDLFLNPAVGTTNLETFFNMLQLDGFNPLVLNPVRIQVQRDVLNRIGLKPTDESKRNYMSILKEPVLLGRLYEFIKKYSDDPLKVDSYFQQIVEASSSQQGIQHGEGFWIDHWTYNLDHLDQYLTIFPEKIAWLLFEKNDFCFYDSDHFVRPRREKYIITSEGKFRQYNAVVHHPQKHDLISGRTSDATKVRLENGIGDIYYTNLFIKLLSLAVMKISSLDPFGAGIEMEADKPGWCDALNGLPGLFGSSSHEMYETHRLVKFLLNKALPSAINKSIDMPTELYTFMREAGSALESNSGKDFRPVWDRMASARESFREKTFMGLSGKVRNIRFSDVKDFLTVASEVLKDAEKKAIDPKTGIPTSYFSYEVDVSELKDGWRQFLHKLPWEQHRVPPFLEGPVHALKMADPSKAKRLLRTVKASDLYDKKLGMYRLNAPLYDESHELGRVRIFTKGWLENESIFLHMHYKYLLEILRSGFTDVFLNEMKTGLIPFRNAETYGRPLFENSSFIASSAFPDAKVHGRGFVARLSGATSEFLSMIYLMAFGHKPFRIHEGAVLFAPDPQLPKEWFAKGDGVSVPKNSLSIKLFGVPLTFINESGRNTFGAGAVKPSEYEWILDGRFYKHKGKMLPVEATQALREGRLETLTIFLTK